MSFYEKFQRAFFDDPPAYPTEQYRQVSRTVDVDLSVVQRLIDGTIFTDYVLWERELSE